MLLYEKELEMVSLPKYDKKNEIISFVDVDSYLNIHDIFKGETIKHIFVRANYYECLNTEEVLMVNEDSDLVIYNIITRDITIVKNNISIFSLSNNNRFIFARDLDFNLRNTGKLIDLETGLEQDIILNNVYAITTTKPTDDGNFIIALIDKHKSNAIYEDDIYIIRVSDGKMRRTNHPAGYVDAIYIID